MKNFISKYWRTVVSGALFAIGGTIMYFDGRRDATNEIVEAAKEIHDLRETLEK